MSLLLNLVPPSLRKGLRRLHSGFVVYNPISRLRQWIHSPYFLGDCYTLEDHTQVTLFTDQPGLFPEYYPMKPLKESPRLRRVRVSVVVTARNERNTARALFENLMDQTRPPDEIVVIDTGSQDGTLELLRELAGESRVTCHVLEEKGANIARGRNLAITQAQYEVIAVTDFGCWQPPSWLDNLVAPFEIDPQIQVSAGRFQAVDASRRQVPWLLGRTLEGIEPQSYLPASNSVAFTKASWEGAEGYPEWLTLTGEDTYYALELKRTTMRWAFVPEAVVGWDAPVRLPDCWRKAYRWSIGDGEAGMTARAYRWLVFQLGSLGLVSAAMLALIGLALLSGSLLLQVSALLAALAGLGWFLRRLRKSRLTPRGLLLRLGTNLAQVIGFLVGLRRRPLVNQRREKGLQGTFFILAGVPIDDTGGGARWTQIALEMIRHRKLVVFIHKFPKYERKNLNLSIRHPNLIVSSLADFRWRKLLEEHAGILKTRPIMALVETPLEEFLPIVQEVVKISGTVIYDLIDDWSTSLGQPWYAEATEKALIDSSQVLTATAPVLQQRLERLSRRKVHLLPNAVNSYLFDPSRYYSVPADMPIGDWLVIYVGALWGEWFDWDLLDQVARAYPEAAVVVVGDYAGQHLHPPPNLHFLGLKPQRELPAYLAHVEVAMIPWKVTPITRATSPLKVYEYIAMRKPVVAPDLPPLHNLPGVTLADGIDDFISKVGAAAQFPVDGEAAASFVENNCWQRRVTELLELARIAREAHG